MDTRNICPACNSLYDSSILVCVRCGTGLLEIPDAPILSGTTLDMRYDIEGVVGTGGMGTVYRARQRGMEREVAIKVLHPRFAHEPRAVKRFFREAQAASRLIHPNIVTVYDFGRAAEGHLYMVMELLEGYTLGDMIHYRAPLPPALALAVLTQICEALEEAHRQRLVHRDLKPDNVLLTTTEDGVWAKVLDFGIARMVRDQSDGNGLDKNYSTVEIAGTPAYMSPEQILGKEPDPRSDLYSLGIMLFEMLTRQRPFDDESSVTLCMKQLNDDPPLIASVTGEGGSAVTVSEPLERLVRALLEKRPERRPQRATEVKLLIGRCPESSFPYSVPPMELPKAHEQGGGGRALSVRTTRGEAALMSIKTLEVAPALPDQRPNSRVGLRPDAQAAPADETSLLGGLVLPARPWPRAGAPEPRPAKAASFGAVAQIVAEHPGALATGELAIWLDAQAAAGWELHREEQRVLVKVPGEDPAESMRVGGASLAALQERALAKNLGLRIGLAPIENGSVAEAVDQARRLAVATTHGHVAIASSVAGRVGLGVRPQTNIFMPNGSVLEASVIRRGPARSSTSDAVLTSGARDNEPALLWGRGLQLRRLGQLGDEATRKGPTAVLIQGARGMGKSSILDVFLNGRRALRTRVSPVAAAWPGHALAQLVAASLGIHELRGRAGELDALSELELGDRERELLELLLLDRPVLEPPRVRVLARLVHDLIALHANDEALVVAIDDAHYLDRASREVLEQVVKLARAASRPWCFAATARWVKPETFLAGEARVDLRPLGLRAMNQLAEVLKVAPRQRHGLLAAAQGNPLALKLLVPLTCGQEPSTQIHQLGEGLLPWLLSTQLRQADPRDADRAWLAAVLGEGRDDDPLVPAARLYLERELPKEMSSWLCDRLTREGPLPEALGTAFIEATMAEATRRAQRCERLGLFNLAALELETALPLSGHGERAAKELEVANLRALSGDVQGALDSFEASTRTSGERRPTALLRFARTLLELGQDDQAADALELAEQALEVQRSGQPVESYARSLGEWLVLRGRTTLKRGDLSGAASALQGARELAEQVARSDARVSRGLQALVQETRAELALAMGDREAARTNLRQARDAFRDLGQHADALRCLIALGDLELAMGDLRRAADTFRAASRLAATASLVREELMAEVGLGETELALGELDDGSHRLRAAFRRVAAEEEERQLGSRAALGMAQAMLARRLYADVFRYLERARSLTRSPHVAARAAIVAASAHLAQRQLRKALKALTEAGEAAQAAHDAILLERVRELRGEAELAAIAPASAR